MIEMSLKIHGLFHLYHTNSLDNKDCLYSFTSNNIVNEWQLISYCIRNDMINSENNNSNDNYCHGDRDYTFEELKLTNVDSYDLYRWSASIETIDQYEKYLTGVDFSLSNYSYCNCSGNVKIVDFID